MLNENDFSTLVSYDHVGYYTIHDYLFSVKHSLESTPSGFTISNDEMFCIFPNSRAIRVYNNEPFVFQRTITVKGMKRPYDIVAGDNVLYVSERGDKSVHRIQLPEETVSNWSVDGTRLTLSISKNGNVIVASRYPAKIFEYSSDGKLVREIVVDLIGLRHAIQLEGDKFLVGHKQKSLYRVCIVDNTSSVIKCYGRSMGPGVRQSNGPLHLAIGRNGSILVADYDNNRIVQLNSSLEYMNDFASFKQPKRLLLNKELGRLFVVDLNRSITILEM